METKPLKVKITFKSGRIIERTEDSYQSDEFIVYCRDILTQETPEGTVTTAFSIESDLCFATDAIETIEPVEE